MRLASVVLMAMVMVALVVFAFSCSFALHVQLKPLAPRASLPSLGDVRPDSPERPQPTAWRTAHAWALLGPRCKETVRAEAERRRLPLKGARIAALGECSFERVMFTRERSHDDRIDGLQLLTTSMEARRRAELDDAAYLRLLADAEQACSGR